MIQAVNIVNFQGRFGRYSSHTPKVRSYREFEFMPELQKQNHIKNFFKQMYETYKGICDAMKPEKKECFEMNDYRCTTIEI